MAKTVWKLTAIKNSGKLVKGMNVEIITLGGKPTTQAITEAINAKYGVTALPGNCVVYHFEIEKL